MTAATYRIPNNDGTDVIVLPRVSDVKKLLADPFNLTRWKNRKLAQQLARDPSLANLAATGDPKLIDEAIRKADDRDTGKTDNGTVIHHLIENYNAGTLDDDMVSDSLRPYITEWAKVAHRVQVLESEVVLYNLTAGYAGRTDLIARVDGGRPSIVDYKSGGVFDEMALQLAAYAWAEGIWTAPAEFPQVKDAWAQLDIDQRDGVNIPPTASGNARSKWNTAAVKDRQADIWRLHDSLLMAHDGKREMPEGIDRSTGYIVCWPKDDNGQVTGCDIVPVKLDTNPHAFTAFSSLALVHQWSKFSRLVGKPIPEFATGGIISDTATLATVGSAGCVVSAVSQGVDTADGSVSAPVAATTAAVPAWMADRLSDPLPVDHRPRRINELTDPEMREYLTDAIRAIGVDARMIAAEEWPAGVPTLKKATNHTRGELDAILHVVVDAALTYGQLDELPDATAYLDRRVTVEQSEDDAARLVKAAFPLADELAPDAMKQSFASRLGLIRKHSADYFAQITDAMAEHHLPAKVIRDDWTMTQLSTLERIIVPVQYRVNSDKREAQAALNDQASLL